MSKIRRVIGAIIFMIGLIMLGFFASTLDGVYASFEFFKYSVGYFLISVLGNIVGLLLLFWPSKNKLNKSNYQKNINIYNKRE